VIVFDTNVISEPLKPHPDPGVLGWIDRQRRSQLFITAISLAELLIGVEGLPFGRRRSILENTLEQFIRRLFDDRVLAFDERSARGQATIASRVRSDGKTISFADAQIAAIAAVHGFAVATRDTAPFIAAGVQVIDPWSEGSAQA